MAFVVGRFPVVSETFILRQVTGLLDLGCDVRVLSERRPEDTVVHPAVRDYGLLDRVKYVVDSDGGGPTRRARLSAFGRAFVRHPGSAVTLLAGARAGAAVGGPGATLRRLHALLQAGALDLIHCHFGNVGLRYARVAQCLRIPLVTSFYGYDCSKFPLEHGRDVYLPLFRSSAGVTVLSEQMRARLVALGCPPDAIHKQHLGVDPREFPYRERVPPAPGEPVRILTVARLVEKKGVEYALEAVARVLPRDGSLARDFRYDIVGDGPLRGQLEAKAASLGLSSHVHFWGSQDQSGVQRAMAEAHVFLLPSVIAADGDEEGTPTVLAEASCVGLPVLSTRHSGIPEMVLDGRTGFLVPERDVAALADRLEELLARPELWAEMGREGRRHVEAEFDVRKLNQRLVSLYAELGRRPAGSQLSRDAGSGYPLA